VNLHDFARSLGTCTYCPSMCRHTCPVADAEAREAVTPQAKMATLESLRTGRFAFSTPAASVLYACNGCGACTQSCVHGIDVATALFAGRAAAVEQRSGHPALAGLPARFFSRVRTRRARLETWLGDRFRDRAELAFLPGCASLGAGAASLRRELAVLAAFGLPDVPVADLPFCCAGYPLWASGHRVELARVAAETTCALSGFSTLASACPACVWMLRKVYPSLGERPATRVVHVSEILAERLFTVRLRRRPIRALYQDACYLGRHLEIRDPPRRLASACVEALVEAPTAGVSGCSGGGGLVPLTSPETAAGTAARRVEESRQAGAGLIVTACPTARRALAKAARGARVLSLLDLLAGAARTV
jgi:Fe-S oxidoreductase